MLKDGVCVNECPVNQVKVNDKLIKEVDKFTYLGSVIEQSGGCDADIARRMELGADAVRRVRAANPAVIYVCDPVLGDNGALYTPEGLAAIYREELLPQATVLTPNAFEAELLTDLPCTTEEEGLAVCAALHAVSVGTTRRTSGVRMGSVLAPARARLMGVNFCMQHDLPL